MRAIAAFVEAAAWIIGDPKVASCPPAKPTSRYCSPPSVRVPWTLAELRREWNRAKHQVAPWWPDNSKEAYNSGLDALARALKKRRLNRELARRTPGSRRRNRTRRRLARIHARAANLRRDGLHKLTTRLATEHGIVVVEQLNVAGMVRNRRLARVVSDTGMAELRRQLGSR
jgi:hypothetical protein